MHDAVPVSNAPSSSAIQAHRVNLVYEGDCPKLMGRVAHLLQRTNRTCVTEVEEKGLAISLHIVYKTTFDHILFLAQAHICTNASSAFLNVSMIINEQLCNKLA